jgi:hypothetical protein
VKEVAAVFDPAWIEALALTAPALHAAVNRHRDAPRRILDQVARRYIGIMLKEAFDQAANVQPYAPLFAG